MYDVVRTAVKFDNPNLSMFREIFVIVLPLFLLSGDNAINVLPKSGRIHF